VLHGIERLGHDRIRIGPKEFRLFVNEHRLPDGTSLGVEVAGRPNCGYQDLFEIDYLKGVAAHQLLPGLSITIYAPRLATKQIESLEVRNPYGAPVLSFAISHDYVDWNHKSNLIHFSNSLAAELLKNLPDCVSASSKADDQNVLVAVRLDVPQTVDLYEYIDRIDQCVSKILSNCLGYSGELEPGSVVALKPDEHGYKWWLRYVVIPVLGSAALIALLNWIF
jgi:hypothetical protein